MLKIYLRNIWLYCHWHWLWDETRITYKRGWGPWKFLLLVFWWDYGAAVLLGRGVQSLSRAFELLGEDHWLRTGPILWGSVDQWKR